MTAVHNLPVTPQADMMRNMIMRLFEHAGMRGLVEISWTSTRAPHKLSGGKLFDLADLDIAADEATTLNASPNRNVYVSAGLRKPGTPTQERAKDEDVFACVALWCDFDDPRGLERGIEEAININLAPNLVVITGNEPHTRGQLWWILDEPTEDLALHNRLIRALTVRLNGDRAVTNPSRVMRIGGSVAWPLKAGRTLELTELAEHKLATPKPYELTYIQWRLEQCGALNEELPGNAPSFAEPRALLDFNGAQPQLDLEALIDQARKPGEWHGAMLKATAHLIARGTPPDVVLDMLTPQAQQPGFTHHRTRQELRTMIEGAISRGFAPDPHPAPAPELMTDESPFLSIDQLADLPPVEWILDGYLPRVGMSAMFAPPGAFKSFIALDMALSIAYGMPWHGFPTQQRKVLYVLGEGKHGFATRALAWIQHRADGVRTDQFHVLPVPVNFMDPRNVDLLMEKIELHLGGVGFNVIDTLARNFGPGDENSTKDMNAYIAGSTRLMERGCHVMHVHHSGKDESKDERGSSAFRAALDTAIKLDREPGSDTVRVIVRKQKDGPEASPITLTMALAELVHPVTGEILQSRVPTHAEPVENASTGTPVDQRMGLSKLQIQLLDLVRSGVGSPTVLVMQSGANKSNVRRALLRLSDRDLIKQDNGGFWKPNGQRLSVSENEQKQDDKEANGQPDNQTDNQN